MMYDNKVFRRQFLIARIPISLGPDWRNRSLPEGWVLSYHKDLNLSERTAAGGRSILVFGNAYCVDALEKGDAVGRFAYLDWPYVCNDRAGALLSIFCGRRGDVLVASSSASLAAIALGQDSETPDFRHPFPPGRAQRYMPAPGTRYRHVRRMLRDQRLNLREGQIERNRAPIVALASYDAAIETVTAELKRFAGELRDRTTGTIFVQLSAGLDSRTIVAAFAAQGVSFETTTFNEGKEGTDVDATVAGSISRKLGIRHTITGLGTSEPEMQKVYWLQTGACVEGTSTTLFARDGGYRFLKPGDVLVGGACFELGREYFGKRLGNLTLETATGAEIWRRLGRQDGPPEFCAFLDEWLDWRRADPYGMSFLASHYLDQRLGAWASTLASAQDLLEGITIQPANNQRIFSALITPSLEDQMAGRLQKDAIGQLCPALMDFPINPVPFAGRVRRKVWKLKRAFRRRLRGQSVLMNERGP